MSETSTPTVQTPPPTPEERVRALAQQVTADRDLFLVDVVVRGRKGSQVVEVYVDADDALDVDALAEVSRELDFLLELEDVIKGKYHLNVSSPGADRPLAHPRQYKKHIGRTLDVTYHAGDRRLSVTGELTAADREGIDLAPPQGEAVRVGYDAIEEARVALPW